MSVESGLSRRQFMRAGAAFSALPLLDSACRSTNEDSIFPEGKLIDLTFFEDNRNISRIVQASQKFPRLDATARDQNISSPPDRKLMDFSSVEKLKIASIGIGVIPPDLRTLISIQFHQGAYIGSEFSQSSNNVYYPAYIVTPTENNPLISEAIKIYIGAADSTTPLQYLDFEFGIKTEQTFGLDLVVILNKGLLHGQTKAALLPIKFHTLPTAIRVS